MPRTRGLAFGRQLFGPIDFSDMSGGVVTAFPPHSLRNNEVANCLNALFEKRGFSKWPAYVGVATAALFTAPLRGEFVYKLPDGSEAYIAVSDKKIYSVDLVAGTKTKLADITADTECYAVNYMGKLWIVNGTDQVKIESNLAVYQIGITIPSGFTLGGATAIAGTLPAGVYDVYVTYTRQISGVNVLDSEPFHVGNVTLDGSHGIRIVKAVSADPQVTHITAWVTDAGGTNYYYYGISTNAVGNFDIANNSNRNVSLLLYEQAAANQKPTGMTYIYAFAGRLWGVKANSNELYYCMIAQNVYDLEKWSTAFHIPTIPFTIFSVHGVGSDLCANTAGGMYHIPSGDVSAKPQPITQGSISNTQILNFPKYHIGSIAEYNGSLFGFTNDGFRIFDGNKFSIDLSKHIKPQIDVLMQNAGNFLLSGVIFRRSGKRTEYHLSYNDGSVSVTCHNRKLVLNLDRLSITDNETYTAPWEFVQGGFSHAVVAAGNKLVVGQSISSAATIAQESGTSDMYCFDDQGVFLTAAVARTVYVRSRTEIQELAGIDEWKRIYTLATLSTPCNGKLVIPDKYQYFANFACESTGGANPPILDVDPQVILDDPAHPFILPADNPLSEFRKFPPNAKGNAMYIELSQTADDPKFFVFEIQAYGFHEKNAFV